ncbi:hypothetical protein EDD16DRAFT_1546659 [Pisolithus croceorrhizus]|nr:hypothetical protein EV401DRAFT_1271224 [Pisolithus croceorrhizus]KAI6129001.1 hypothetical protein EDD16DRAFT_1546659 [Pisolithus croceorrhizus]KAI6168079.1 hypothetical protein EDD17DRAFT_744251 [Pisolithus thermaeus]
MSSGSERSIYFDAPMYPSRSSSDDNKHDTDTRRRSMPVRQQGLHSAEIAAKAPGYEVEGKANGISGRRKSRTQSQQLSRTYGSPKLNSPRNAKASNDRADEAAADTNDPIRPEQARRTSSFHSLPELTGDRNRDDESLTKFKSSGDGVRRKASVRTTRTTASAFVDGSALTGPNAEPDVDESIYRRGASAERTLSKKEKEKIYKEEMKESKQLSKLLKLEAMTEKTALNAAICKLASLQDLHKDAIKREAKAETAHAKAVAAVQKAESKYHEAKAQAAEARAKAEVRVLEERAKLEGKEAEVKAQEERIEAEKQIVRELEERLAECAREVERLRIIKATDERERMAKIMELSGKTLEG